MITVAATIILAQPSQDRLLLGCSHVWLGTAFAGYQFETDYVDPENGQVRDRMLRVYPGTSGLAEQLATEVGYVIESGQPVAQDTEAMQFYSEFLVNPGNERQVSEQIKNELIAWYAELEIPVAENEIAVNGYAAPMVPTVSTTLTLYRGSPVAVRKLPNRQRNSADTDWIQPKGRLLLRPTQQLLNLPETGYERVDITAHFSSPPVLERLSYRLFVFFAGSADIGSEQALYSVPLTPYVRVDPAAYALDPETEATITDPSLLVGSWHIDDAIGADLVTRSAIVLVIGLYRTGWASGFATANVAEAGRLIRAALEFS